LEKEKMKTSSVTVKEKKKTKQSAIEKIWILFKETNDQDARDKLILQYSPLVKYVAGRVSANLPSNVEKADLISYGIFGLMDAIEKYDLSRKIKFETYAVARIKGAIIDELRSLDWVPRSVRHHSRLLEKAYIELENKLRRVPTDEEVAEKLEITVVELQSWLTKISYTSIAALEDVWISGGEKDEKLSLIDTVEDTSAVNPSEVFEISEMKNILASAIDYLPEREKTVVALYYYEGLTLREIGEVLGVTESRVSQLHTKAIIRLKAKLRIAKPSV